MVCTYLVFLLQELHSTRRVLAGEQSRAFQLQVPHLRHILPIHREIEFYQNCFCYATEQIYQHG